MTSKAKTSLHSNKINNIRWYHTQSFWYI